MKIRNRLTITYGLIALLSVTTISLITVFGFIEIFKDRTEKNYHQILRQLNTNIEANIEYIDDLSIYVSYNEAVQDFLINDRGLNQRQDLDRMYDVEEILSMLLSYNDFVSGIYIYSKNSDNFAFSDKNLGFALQKSVQEQTWYEKLINSKEVKIYDTDKHANNVDRYIMARKVLDNATGELIGYVMISCDTQIIGDMIKDYSLGNLGVVSIYSDEDLVFQTKIASNNVFSAAMKKYRASQNATYIDSIKGKKVQVNTFKSSQTGWSFESVMPLEYLYTGFDNIIITIIITCIVIVLIMIILSTLLAKTISEPINTLKNHMKKVMSGDFKTKLKIDRKDEIGQMMQTFNKTTLKLDEMITIVYQSELRQQQAEIAALQAQINPHFLYNTLESIKMLALLNDDYDVSKMISTLGKYLRFAIDNKSKIVTVKEELEHLERYIDIFKLKNNSFIYKQDIDIDTLKCKICKMSIQPVVENCLKYGIEGINNSVISLKTWIDNNRILYISIHDNGHSIPKEKLVELKKRINQGKEYNGGTSIGLVNIHTRAQLFFGKEYGLTVKSEAGYGTKVVLKIPAKYEGEI